MADTNTEEIKYLDYNGLKHFKDKIFENLPSGDGVISGTSAEIQAMIEAGTIKEGDVVVITDDGADEQPLSVITVDLETYNANKAYYDGLDALVFIEDAGSGALSAEDIALSNGLSVEDALTDLLTKTLTAGETSLEFTSSRIKSTSIVDPYYQVDDGAEIEPISYKTIKVENGKITMTFDALENDITVAVRVL